MTQLILPMPDPNLERALINAFRKAGHISTSLLITQAAFDLGTRPKDYMRMSENLKEALKFSTRIKVKNGVASYRLTECSDNQPRCT